MNCLDCGDKISGPRLAILPETEYCVDCSSKHIQPVIARMIYSQDRR